MNTRERGLRRTAVVSVTLAATAVVGSLATAGAIAYSHTVVKETSNSSTTGNGTAVTTVPDDSGAHATSGGS
jgi:hypothetical protein